MFQWLNSSQNEDPPSSASIWASLSLLSAAVFIFLTCLLFHYLCDPPPTKFEQAVFYAIIFLIFLETVYTGMYRSEK